MVPSSIPALTMHARRKVADHLTGVGATSAGSAVTYLPTSKLEKSALTYFQRKGVVSLADGGRYWIDQSKAAGLHRANRTRAAMVVGGALAAAATFFAFTRRPS